MHAPCSERHGRDDGDVPERGGMLDERFVRIHLRHIVHGRPRGRLKSVIWSVTDEMIVVIRLGLSG